MRTQHFIRRDRHFPIRQSAVSHFAYMSPQRSRGTHSRPFLDLPGLPVLCSAFAALLIAMVILPEISQLFGQLLAVMPK
ncbi:MAG: hypothetical protein OSA97_15880 [Nevskia sp.]|nr:hypothetical protein [Nevskia sp.]